MNFVLRDFAGFLLKKRVTSATDEKKVNSKLTKSGVGLKYFAQFASNLVTPLVIRIFNDTAHVMTSNIPADLTTWDKYRT